MQELYKLHELPANLKFDIYLESFCLFTHLLLRTLFKRIGQDRLTKIQPDLLLIILEKITKESTNLSSNDLTNIPTLIIERLNQAEIVYGQCKTLLDPNHLKNTILWEFSKRIFANCCPNPEISMTSMLIASQKLPIINEFKLILNEA